MNGAEKLVPEISPKHGPLSLDPEHVAQQNFRQRHDSLARSHSIKDYRAACTPP